ncbi:la-related protein CG11505 [Trichonephila clavipes]|nr:la-related protein CG11505 [Trichonephila clavipes]
MKAVSVLEHFSDHDSIHQKLKKNTASVYSIAQLGRIYCDVTGLRYIVQPCLLFTTPAFFVTLSSLVPTFPPLLLPDPLYLVSRSTCCQARIKAKAITSAPFTTSYKNGYSNHQETDNYNGQNVNQQQQQPPLQYAYNVANESYNNQQVVSPFYPPTMLQAWAPTTPPCVDLGTVLSVNGLTPQTAYRPIPGNSSRHNYTSTRESEQNRYFNRGQSTSYLGRQQLHQQAASFPSIVNANNCATFDYLPYATRSRNLHNFGMDMNFFTAPNLYYSKIPSVYQAHSSQTRHNPVMMPRSQVGVGAINCQDQTYLAVGNSNTMPYSKDSGMNAVSGSKQGADSQVKENWAPNQRQQRNKRWWKEGGSSGSSRNYSDNSNGSYNKSLNENEAKPESPKFDLETTSFPPLPGCLETGIIDDAVFESRLSDIVKGTVKTTRDTKTQTSESGIVVCHSNTKDSSTITIEDNIVSSDGAFTPPDSPDVVTETGSTTEPMLNVENCQESNEWDDFVESPSESILCNTSINQINIVPEVPSTFNGNSTPVFQVVSTNSLVNGSVATTENSTPTNPPDAEPIANVPSEIINEKQTAVVKLPKAKQLESIPKNNRPLCDLPSPKNKTSDVSIKNKFDSLKDRAPIAKHRTSFSSNNKNSDSSSSNKNEKVSDYLQAISKPAEHGVSKNSEIFHVKDKVAQGHGKNKILDSNSSKINKTMESESTLTVNGHADSESTVSSEQLKSELLPQREMANNQSDRRHLDAFTRCRIIGKLEEGRSVTSVAAEFRIAHSIVSRLWRQFQTTGKAIRGFSSGRPRGTTPADDRYIIL